MVFTGPGIATIIIVPFQLVAYLYNDIAPAIASLCVVAIMGSVYLGHPLPYFQPRIFAYASSGFRYLLVLNLIAGLGPWFVGILSDILMPTMGIESSICPMCRRLS